MAQSAEHILGKDEVPGSNPGISSILVEQKRCPPFTARSYGLFRRFRGKKFMVKTVDAF